MAFDIKDFRKEFADGGARPSLFQVAFFQPTDILGTVLTEGSMHTAEATTIPSYNVGSVPMHYFGRQMNFGGDRVYQPWTCRFINKESFETRTAMKRWQNLVSRTNFTSSAIREKREEKAVLGKIGIMQYGKNGDPIAGFLLHNAFPVAVGEIELGWSTVNQIERFQCQFVYDYFEEYSKIDAALKLTDMVKKAELNPANIASQSL